jgi:LPXTG-site transpeptidase (sortase) family protein
MPTKAKSAAGQSVAGLLLALACVLVLAGMVLPSGGAADAGRPGLTPSSKPIGPPQRLVVPAIGLGAPVTPIEVNTAGVLDPPAAVDTVGWWQRSAEPGAHRGQTLVTGHSVHDGDGAMDRLVEVEPGDTIRLRAGNRMAQYRATRVVVYSRAELADNSRKLFGQDTGSGRLVLVTCTDWNGASYDNNVVVFARPVRGA